MVIDGLETKYLMLNVGENRRHDREEHARSLMEHKRSRKHGRDIRFIEQAGVLSFVSSDVVVLTQPSWGSFVLRCETHVLLSDVNV